jgi:hypothetical protein
LFYTFVSRPLTVPLYNMLPIMNLAAITIKRLRQCNEILDDALES